MEEKRVVHRAVRKPLMILFLCIAAFVAFGAVLIIAASDEVEAFAALLICAAICVGVAFASGHINARTYVFTETGIDVLRGKKQLRRYDIADITELRYVSFSSMFKYMGLPFAQRKGICLCLYIFTKDGKSEALLWGNEELARKIQSELYGGLVVIY